MESIREIFKDKGFSDEALSYLENAINEFEEVFGNYVSREDLIERVKNNVNVIEFVDTIDELNERTSGIYSCIDKKIQISTNFDEEEKKAVFFHEFLHAIVADGKNTGFRRCYQVHGLDDVELSIGTGWNEGFVEMMTQMRNIKILQKNVGKAYPILTKSVKKFAELFGKEELIDIYLNQPKELMNFLKEKSKTISSDFLLNFDVIHAYEREIIKKIRNESRKKLFFESSGIDQEYYDGGLINAQENIIQVYVDETLHREIESFPDLYKSLFKIDDIYRIFSKSISVQTIGKIVGALNPEILSQVDFLDEKTRTYIQSYLLLEKFKDAKMEEKFEMLIDRDNGIVNKMLGNLDENNQSLMYDFFSNIIQNLYGELKDFTGEDMFYWIYSFSGVAKYIIDNNLSFENLKIVYNEYKSGGIVYELYNLQENGEYAKVTTLAEEDIELDIEEYKDVEDEEKGEISQKISDVCFYPATEVVGNGRGNFVANIELAEQIVQRFVSTEHDEIEEPRKTMVIESITELQQKRDQAVRQFENVTTEYMQIQMMEKIKLLKGRKERLGKLESQQAPSVIIEHERKRIRECEEEVNNLRYAINARTSKKITPSQIEAKTITGNVTIPSLQSTLEDLATQDKVMENEGEEFNVK